MWLKAFTIAIVEKDIDKLNHLMDVIPEFDKKADIQSAVALINEAKKLVETLRDDTQNSMIQMQKNIKFLKSTQAPTISKLDVSF
jgi:hypothetical protein